jgi:uncharacterized protein YecE (DUF72 family)
MTTPRASPEFRVGTSGWNYYDWRGEFYPAELKPREWLKFYAREFDTTEVNYSFYHLPRRTTYESWSASTPDNFVFALKASRPITHLKRLHNVAAEWRKFIDGAAALGAKLGPILLQFPPSFAAKRESLTRLEKFLDRAARSPGRRLAFEFRHASWFEKAPLSILERHAAALVVAQSSRYPQPEIAAAAPFAYFRFHGPRELFASSYSGAELRGWARAIKAILNEGRDVYAYFNNTAFGYAIANAYALRKLIR